MAIMKKLRPFAVLRAAKAATAGVQAQAPIDIWLSRISYVSQFGLFLFTVGTIYFTVIPLYQKALLDEQIAEKQIQLNRMEDSLHSSYRKIRAHALRDFEFQAGAECSGLLIPAPSLQRISRSKQEPSHAELVLAIDPINCLTRMISSTKSLRELNVSDRSVLEMKVRGIAASLETKRQAAIARLGRAEATVDSDPSRSDPATVKPGTVADFVFRNEPPQWQRKVLRRAAIEKERSDAAFAYGAQVRTKVSELHSVKWDKDTASGL